MKPFKFLLTILSLVTALVISTASHAALLTNWGKAAYRDGQNIEGQYIAWEFLNDRVVYGIMNHLETLNSSAVKMLCGDPNEEYRGGKRLFDLDPDLCANPQKLEDEYSVYRITILWKVSRWNYYLLIAPSSEMNQLQGKIVEIQMGSTNTRTPPKVLRVMEKSDTCKDDGWGGNVKIICNGWSWESLEPYWGKPVPPELKALNGTGVKKQRHLQIKLIKYQPAQPQ